MKHRGWISLSGFIWMFAGVSLLYKGLRFVSEGTLVVDSWSFRMKGLFGSPAQAGTVIIAMGLLIGFLKGRFVFAKTVNRVVTRIQSLTLPIRLSEVYTPSYWILIIGMMSLGMLFRFLPLPIDVRGLIDVAIGSALVNGSMLYFRAARSLVV